MSTQVAGERKQAPESRKASRRKYRRFVRNRASLVGGMMVVFAIVVALVAPLVAPYDPLETSLGSSLQRPSRAHIMGTDELGRDLFSRILFGARISISVAVLAVAMGLVAGVPLGLVTGYLGGLIDSLGMRFVDVLLAFPRLLLALLVVAALGVGLQNTAIAVSLFSVPTFARVVRATALKVKEQDYVKAAQALGARHGWILTKHVLPNSLTPVIVLATTSIARAIIAVAALSFLGLGAKPPTPEWGMMMAEGRSFLRRAPYLSFFPGLAITFVVLGFNFLGDGLRDALDPRVIP
jgi:peptide/nickel transport system permease protein